MDAFETIKRTIEERGLIRDGDTVIAGFSGGPDSLCLLHCLLRLSETRRWRICAVHVNHQLRGKAADEDQAFAEAFCEEKGIPCFTRRVDVTRMVREEGLSTEDAGRRARYRAFEEVRDRLAAQDGGLETDRKDGDARAEAGRYLVAVAQNANDQAETVLMRIMRGAGLSGLGAMDYSREDGVIRPLLDVTREQVEAYCEEQGLCPRVDLTNLEPDYTRNRVRLELLPYMKNRYNENIVETLNRLAAIAREDSSYIDDVARRLTEEALGAPIQQPGGEGPAPERLSVPLDALESQPPAVRHRMIFLLLACLGLDRNISAVHLRQADRVIAGGRTSAAAVFPQGFRMRLSYGSAVFERVSERNGKKGVLEMKILSAGRLKHPARLPADRRAFDREAVEGTGMEPVLRTRRAGDFIRPFGMKGTKKLQDYFVDKKVPRELRDELPLVCLGSEVIWVPEAEGIAGTTGEPYKVRPDTGEILLLQIRKMK